MAQAAAVTERAQTYGRAPPRLLAPLIVLMATLGLLWCIGFAWFAFTAIRPAGPVPDADGIVVLTGGVGRIETALDLLEQNRARLMLISGVPMHLDLDEIVRAAGGRLPSGFANRIALGHSATSTVGNASETASWARANGLRSLIVVTAGYHMRRALAEIRMALPDVALHPDPVQPPALTRPGFGTVRLLAAEYSKWLVVELGLTGSTSLRNIT